MVISNLNILMQLRLHAGYEHDYTQPVKKIEIEDVVDTDDDVDDYV